MLSHAVIEHVADAPLYLRECARVLAPGGHVYLSTAPYLSFAGAHLPRLKVPVPLHLMVGRRAAFATFRLLARHAAWTLKEPANENSFIKAARRGEVKQDDLLEKVRVTRLRRQIADAGLRIVREELHVDGDRAPAAGAAGALAARQPADAGCAHQQHGVRAGAGESGRSQPTLTGPIDDPRTSCGARAWRRSPLSAGRQARGRALYRRVFGNDAAEASRLRWEWQYRRNPNNPGREPEIWIAREGTAIVGQYATMPVQAVGEGREVRGSWGMDVMVAPERQRQGLGEVLFRTWDRNVGASLGPRPVGVVVIDCSRSCAGRTSARCRAWSSR